jgi:hypothetical protein
LPGVIEQLLQILSNRTSSLKHSRTTHPPCGQLHLGLIGPSGSGKTYSALKIAEGLGGKIALLDTERGSGSLYADLCSYDVADLTPPFDPGRYVQAIKGAAEAGYAVQSIVLSTH